MDRMDANADPDADAGANTDTDTDTETETETGNAPGRARRGIETVAAAVDRTRLDGLALKPSENALGPTASLVTVDYEGREHLPGAGTLESLARAARLYVTAPVRADGFDPHGEDGLYERVPPEAGLVFVAGNGAYLDERERERAVAPRLRAALDRYGDGDRRPEPWVGTEGIRRVALAAGGVQYELLSRTTERDVRALRAAGFDGELAVYAPVVRSTDEDAVLDAIGAYVARRKPVQAALPEGAATGASATGRTRDVLRSAATDYALVGNTARVRQRVGELREAGVDTVVGYPARGLAAFG